MEDALTSRLPRPPLLPLPRNLSLSEIILFYCKDNFINHRMATTDFCYRADVQPLIIGSFEAHWSVELGVP